MFSWSRDKVINGDSWRVFAWHTLNTLRPPSNYVKKNYPKSAGVGYFNRLDRRFLDRLEVQ